MNSKLPGAGGKRRPLTPARVRGFRRAVLGHYRSHARQFPWRETADPYRILVSEIMLQQTQTDRVTEKFVRFVGAFPDFRALARSPLKDVLALWQGLGYNRRAISLRKAAQAVTERWNGELPRAPGDLLSLPGIGPYTAAAVRAFAFNLPSVVLDTNIRRVFIHHFFGDRSGVRDAELLPFVEQTLPRGRSCEWYNALMDYGAMLVKRVENPNRRSAHYVRQSRYEGSNRQLRGRILKTLIAEPGAGAYAVASRLDANLERVERSLRELEREGFVRKRDDGYDIA